MESNKILVQVIQAALDRVNYPMNAVQLVSTREDVRCLLELDDYIDLIIPRGSNSLVKYIQSNTRIPVMGHADGICATYIDEHADEQKAINISVDAKTK